MFRIRHPRRLFDVVTDVGSDHVQFLDARAVWACRHCGQKFAWMRIPYKDHEEILVRAVSSDWQTWDWAALAKEEVDGQGEAKYQFGDPRGSARDQAAWARTARDWEA